MTSALAGKRVLVTRAAGQASETAKKLRTRGADPIEIPTIVLDPPEDRRPLLEAASTVGTFDLLAFTSPNAVDAFFAALDEVGLDDRALASIAIAAIGPTTERAIARYGNLRATILPAEHRGEALAEAILAHAVEHRVKRVLLPRAAVARDVLPERLRAHGIDVHLVVAYRTRPPDPSRVASMRDSLLQGAFEAVLFTSGSTVENFCALLDDAPAFLAKTVVASIGPITSEACRVLGVRVDVEAKSATMDSLLDALELYFSTRRRE